MNSQTDYKAYYVFSLQDLEHEVLLQQRKYMGISDCGDVIEEISTLATEVRENWVFPKLSYCG